jgi:GTP cyclohydrolase I
VENTSREIAEEAAERAVAKVFLTLGIDVNDPKSLLETQQDFAAMRDFTRGWRATKGKLVATVLVLLVTALCGMLWSGLKSSV